MAKVTVALPGGGDSVSAASLASALSFGSGGSAGAHIGALSTRRALIRAVASAADGTRYFVWDDDDNPLNNIGGLSGIDGLRSACAEFGLRAVRITSAETVDLTLRPLLQNAGYDLSRGSGVPLAMDYSADNTYSSLDDASIAVTDILASLHESFGYTGDHQTDQTSDKQHLAGFGWAASETDVGVEDWGFQHPMQALICSDQPPAPLVPPAAVAQCPPGRTEIENGRCVDGVMYRVWDDNDDPLDDLAPMEQGILTLRERCAELSLQAVRITSAAVIDDILRPMLQKAGYDLSRGSGVPLAMDFNMRNTYEALDDASVSVGQVLSEVHQQRGYSGDHTTDQTGDKQHLAGLGWARSTADVGIEDWGFQHPMQALICMTPA